jgi:hypothetical protein
MAIAFPCPSCGKRFTVADEMAGRQGSCKGCGCAMTVPFASVEPEVEEEEEMGIARVGYGLVDVPVAPSSAGTSPKIGATVFTAAPPDRSAQLTSYGSGSRKRSHSRSTDDASFMDRYGKPLVISLGGTIFVLLMIALFVPGGRYLAAMSIGGIGTIVFLICYAVGAYVAFTEDVVYGFMFLLIPLYQAYYFVKNWDEMWPWFTGMTLAVMLTFISGWIVSESSQTVEEEAAAANAFQTRDTLAVPLVLVCHPSFAPGIVRG